MRRVWRAAQWAALVMLVCAATASSAAAATFDESGRLLLDGAVAYGFDAEDERLPIALYAIDDRELDVSERFVADAQGLEGSGAFAFGGDAYAATIGLGALSEQFAGRRVELRLWQRAAGTEAQVQLRWAIGEGNDSYTPGTVIFVPTGRATTDGWVELSSGPVDFLLGGVLAPTDLVLYDRHVLAAFVNYQIDLSSEVRVLLDGFEVLDLGPAAVPSTTCTALNERTVCGDDLGVCHFGRCADAAAVMGTVPSSESVRADYVQRRIFEMQAFNGVRAGQHADPDFALGMMDALAGPPRDFWPTITAAYERLRDGHGSPPIVNYDYSGIAAGMCIYLGEADLLPQGGIAPLVYEARADKPTSEAVRPGDVLVSIDGVSVEQWRLAAGRFFYYTGDLESRDALLMPDVVAAAIKTGARLEFARCERLDGVACSEAEVETIEVDFGALVGELIYAGTVPQNAQRGLNCDFRFLDAVPGARTNAYEYAAGRVEDGVSIVQFNGFPSRYWQGGQAWASAMDTALGGSGVSHVLLDQRRGDGGTFDAVVHLTNHVMRSSDRVITETHPWYAAEPSNEELASLRACLQSDAYTCGNLYAQAMPEFARNSDASTARLAVLFGRDVSGNDFFSRALLHRAAPTRTFGSTRTWGAFGFSCPLPGHIGEVLGGNFQCTDSVFYQGSAAPLAGEFVWESGTGVAPDVIVYQKQSDAVNGVDTLIAAAMAWLAEED